MAHFAALNDHAQLIYYISILKSHTWNHVPGLTSSVIVDLSRKLWQIRQPFYQCGQAFPSNKPGPHTGQSHRSCLDIRQLINMVEYLSIYSKDYLQSYHTHIPVSSFGTKKMQRKRSSLCMYMAAGGIKGLIYLEARACFSVHCGISLLIWCS